jgi:adenylate cyclase
MQTAKIERKLAAILSADVKDYSRLTGADEVGTVRTLHAYRETTDSCIAQHYGRIVNTAGDSVLAEFASAVDAVQCAVEIQYALKAKNAELPPERKMEFRIGINVGDVVVEGEQLYGDGVNVAARLQALADVGGIFISGTVYDQIETKLALNYEGLGEQAVKNIAKPVRVWRVVMDEAAAALAATQAALRQASPEPHGGGTAHRAPITWPKGAVVLMSLLLLVGIIISVQYLFFRPPPPSANIPPEQPSALSLPDKPSILVLPFTNMSNDPEQEYFSDGITEDITADLSKISSLFVISRNSAFTYKGKAVKLPEVSRELGVRYVLEGSVRKAGDQVRLTAQLIDATQDQHLWSERYDRPLQDIFALQDEIRQRIVFALTVKLTPEEQARFKTAPTNNLEAYDYYLRGWQLASRNTKETNVQARQMFEKALELDPQYAGAYTGLGFTYWLEWFSQWSADPQNLARAEEMLQKATALDESLPRAHAALGMVKLLQKQYAQATAEMERALALDPSFAQGYANLSHVLIAVGRPEEAVEAAKKAVRLDPRQFQHLNPLGWAYVITGQYEEAIPVLKKVLTYNPTLWVAYGGLAVSYSELGREEEARAAGAEMLRIVPQFSVEKWKPMAPYKDPAVTERLAAAIRKAGLK